MPSTEKMNTVKTQSIRLLPVPRGDLVKQVEWDGSEWMGCCREMEVGLGTPGGGGRIILDLKTNRFVGKGHTRPVYRSS